MLEILRDVTILDLKLFFFFRPSFEWMSSLGLLSILSIRDLIDNCTFSD